jgi:hypothetical protein
MKDFLSKTVLSLYVRLVTYSFPRENKTVIMLCGLAVRNIFWAGHHRITGHSKKLRPSPRSRRHSKNWREQTQPSLVRTM